MNMPLYKYVYSLFNNSLNYFLTLGIVSSICISTMATMANPESRAEVRLEAFSLALLRFKIFQWNILSSTPIVPILFRNREINKIQKIFLEWRLQEVQEM